MKPMRIGSAAAAGVPAKSKRSAAFQAMSKQERDVMAGDQPRAPI
jgi:hypothetical protein